MYPVRITKTDLAHSALPDAPVVPPRTRRHPVRRGRLALAAGLHTIGRVVEPGDGV